MSKNLLNYEGLQHFLSKLQTYIENQRTVKNVDTTASNGINLSNTNGTLDVTVTPGSVADGDTGLVTGDAVYDAIQAGKAIEVKLTASGANQYTADRQAYEVAAALNSGKDAYIIIGFNYTGYVFKAHSGMFYSGSDDVCYCNTTIDYNQNIILRVIKHSGTSAILYTYTVAKLDSPQFTGTPTAPTATTGTNTTQIATTEFVNNAINANAPYIIESTNGVAEKSVTEIASLYYGGTTNLALRYNGRLYPFITFFDSNSMGWGGFISQTNFGTKTQILTVTQTGTNLEFVSIQVNIVKSVNTTASTSGINLSLNAQGELDVSINSGSIESNNTNFVTGGTVYNTTNLLAPKASPALTGTPTAPTADLGTNNTQIATTAFVAQTVANAQIGKAAFQGTVDSQSDIPNVYKKGYHWLVQTAGTYFTYVCEVGDIIYCVADSDATHEASWSIEKDFTVIQNNLDIAIISNAEIDSLFVTESSNDSSNNG